MKGKNLLPSLFLGSIIFLSSYACAAEWITDFTVDWEKNGSRSENLSFEEGYATPAAESATYLSP